MLFLTFQLGLERYALDTAPIVEILPMVAWRPLPGSPPSVVGLINYHGTLVPVLDPARLVSGTSTDIDAPRIALVKYATDTGDRLLGLLLGHATMLVQRRDEDFIEPPVPTTARFAGRMATDEQGMLQRIELVDLVPPDLWERIPIIPESATP